MGSLSELQGSISSGLTAGEYRSVYDVIEGGVDDAVIAELRDIGNQPFIDAVERALATTSEGQPAFQGRATAVLIDPKGNIVGFFSNNQGPDEAIYVRAALQKAAARAHLRGRGRKGLARNEEYLARVGFRRHEGAAEGTIVYQGRTCYIGVSGAAVDDDFNRTAFGTEPLFAATGEDLQWRGAGHWDRFFARRIVTCYRNRFAPEEVGRVRVARHLAKRKFID